jgi:hypothetical protein
VSRPTVTTLDLSVDEQEHVRNAIHFLRLKLGTWKSLARLLHFEEITLTQSADGSRSVTASMAFRIARVANIKVDELITGHFPVPGTCPRCGYKPPKRATLGAPVNADNGKATNGKATRDERA